MHTLCTVGTILHSVSISILHTILCSHSVYLYILGHTHTFNCSGSGSLFAFQIYIVHSSQILWPIARAPTEYMTTTSSKLVEDTVLPRHIRSINFMHGISLAATYIKFYTE